MGAAYYNFGIAEDAAEHGFKNKKCPRQSDWRRHFTTKTRRQ